MDDLSRPYGVEGRRVGAPWERLMVFDQYDGATRYRKHIETTDIEYS